jgi:hypothetical protein
MRIRFIFTVLCLGMSYSQAQTNKTVTISFHPIFGIESLKTPGQQYKLSSGDSLSIETCKFYVSAIELLHGDSLVWNESNSYHLINIFDKNTLTVHLKPPSHVAYDQIWFNVGIDSATNASGALDGDLDPTRGMYWTWQNGYINMKLEGTSNLCSTRNHEFQFHLGGYQFPFNSLQQVQFRTSKKKLHLNVNLGEMMNWIELKNMNHVMSPGKDATKLSQKIPTLFSVSDK